MGLVLGRGGVFKKEYLGKYLVLSVWVHKVSGLLRICQAADNRVVEELSGGR